jgi:hypothetical protein
MAANFICREQAPGPILIESWAHDRMTERWFAMLVRRRVDTGV